MMIKESVSSRCLLFKAIALVMFSSVLTAVTSWIGMKKVAEKKIVLDKEIQKFYFEDYIHAEKD